MSNSRSQSAAIAAWAAVLLPFILFGALPLTLLFTRSLADPNALVSLTSTRVVLLLTRTLAFGVATAALATVIGFVVGWRLGAADWRGRGIARIVLCMPLILPPYVHAIGWTTLLRPGSWLSSSIHGQFGAPRSLIAGMVESWTGAVIILALALYPIPMLFVEKSLALSAPSLVDAARGLGAGRWRAFMTGQWPSMRPSIVSAYVLTFILAVSDLGVATVLKIEVFNFEVFTQLGAFNDTSAAAVLCVPLLAVGWLLWWLDHRTMALDVSLPDRGIELRPTSTRNQFVVTIAIIAGIGFFGIALPLSGLITEVTGDSIRRMATISLRPSVSSAAYGGAASLFIITMAFVLALLHPRLPLWASQVSDGVLMLGFVVPNTITGLALLDTFSSGHSILTAPAGALVVAALVLRYQILGYRIIRGGVVQIPPDWLDAARNLGAGRWRLFRTILVPLTFPAIVAATSICFVLAATDIGSTILLYPPGGETLTIVLYSIEANSPRAYVAAMTLLMVVGIMCSLATALLIWLALRTRSSRRARSG